MHTRALWFLAVLSVLLSVPVLLADEPDATAQNGPHAKVEKGSEFLRRLRRDSSPYLAAMQEKPGYDLKAGKNLRRVPPPFPEERIEFYRTNSPTQAKSIPAGPSAMIFHDDGGRLSNWGMTFGDGYSVMGLIDAILTIKSQLVEGGEVLNRRIDGDWVVRKAAPKQQLITELQSILQSELLIPVRIEWREIQRPVYVARGTYRHTPVEGRQEQEKLITADETISTDPVEIFGKELVRPNHSGGGTGEFSEFLDWLGRWVDRPIISEADVPKSKSISWHLNEHSPSTVQTRDEDHDPTLVLPNITAQTGLTFTTEQRRVKTLFVEQTE